MIPYSGKMNDMKKKSPDSTTKTGDFSAGHAVVIGVANYRHISTLPDAVLNDAGDVADVLTSDNHCGYEKSNQYLLLDGDATLVRIRNALSAVAEASRPRDTVVVFFSGHGAILDRPNGPISAILPVECDAGALDETCLCEPELSAALHSISARRLLVLIDACHSGGVSSFKDQRPVKSPTFGYTEKSLDRLAQGAGRVLIASSRASETSLVLDGERNSVFTHRLLEALRGQGQTSGDGLIRVFEIFNHVSEMVKRSVPGRQHPIFKASDLEDNFPVALHRGGVKTTVSETDHRVTRKIWERLEEIMPDLYPHGPTDQEIWRRAGGDLSRVHLTGTGRESWFRALRVLRQGGGGAGIQKESLVATALEDYPHHPKLVILL